MDFILKIYKKLLHSLLINDYSFQTLENFIQHPNKEKIVILRHDVDRLPSNALVIAKIEKDASIKASYYFRIVKESYDEDIIRQIVEMGHEVGYHYENLSEISRKKEVRSQKEEDRRQRSEDSRLRTRRARALSRQEATSCQGGHGSEQIFLSDGLF